MSEVVIVQPGTTYEWFSSLPLAASAGTAVYNMYEGSKNYSSVTQYALGTMESSVKMAASAVAPVVKKLDKPIQAVDSYAVSKLVKLEEKVPAVKSQPEEVVAYFNESRDTLTSKIAEGRVAISSRFSSSKESLTSHLTSKKDAICSKISAGSDAVANSRAGVLIGEGKQTLTTYYVQGKEALGSTIVSGSNAVYTKVQNGAESLANTRAGSLVGSGIDCTLSATENLVEYLIPKIENEKELFCEYEKKDETPMVGLPRTRCPQTPIDDSPAQAEEGEEQQIGRVDRVCTLSRKVKLRMYYRSMQRLQAMQQNCTSTLQHLKNTVDLLKLAQATRDGVDKQYHNVASVIKDLEEHIKQFLSNKEGTSWLPKDNDEEGIKIEWLSPKPQGVVQSSLDYAKQLSEKVFHTFQSVTVATSYLPHHMKQRTTQAYQHAQEMYSTLKPVKVPTDLPSSALNRISSVLETQLGYVTQLGSYLSSVLQRRVTVPSVENPPASDSDDEYESSESEEEEEGEDEEEEKEL